MCYLSLETVFNTFHSDLIVAEIAGARLGQVDEQTNYNAAYTAVVNWLLHQSKVKFHRWESSPPKCNAIIVIQV